MIADKGRENNTGRNLGLQLFFDGQCRAEPRGFVGCMPHDWIALSFYVDQNCLAKRPRSRFARNCMPEPRRPRFYASLLGRNRFAPHWMAMDYRKLAERRTPTTRCQLERHWTVYSNFFSFAAINVMMDQQSVRLAAQLNILFSLASSIRAESAASFQ